MSQADSMAKVMKDYQEKFEIKTEFQDYDDK